jgi:hypothetical protein
MSSDNAHLALRRRVQRRLGRRITDPAWELAEERYFVDEALDPQYDDGETKLEAFLKSLFSVEDASAPSQATARPAITGSTYTRGLGARIRALSLEAGRLAAEDGAVLAFRIAVLHRETLMTPAEAETFLDDARSAHVGKGLQPLHVLAYQNRTIDWQIHVAQGSPLDRLRMLADELSRSYPWHPSQAAAFVLEGLLPLATPLLVHVPQVPPDIRPGRSRIVLEVDAWVPAASVLDAYRDIQRKLLPGHNKQIGARAIELVRFLALDPSGTWPERLRRWNSAHPDWAFPNFRNFRSAAVRARHSLLPAYRQWFGD